jgi:hypothetical protein
MRIVSVAIVIALAAMPARCQSQQTEDAKILDAFKSLVRRHVESYRSIGREHITKLSGGWAKELFTLDPSSVKFDVERTSSLVNPFVGTLTFTLIRSLSTFHATEAEAAADTALKKWDTTQHTHLFGYQDSKWTPTVRQYKIVGDRFLTGVYPCDEFLTKKEKPSEKDIYGCLEEFDDDN